MLKYRILIELIVLQLMKDGFVQLDESQGPSQ